MSETPAKFKIDPDGTIEVTGSEEFVSKMLQEHKELFLTRINTSIKKGPEKVELKPTDEKTRRRRASQPIEAVDIDLSAGDSYHSLIDFYNEKKPKSFIEKTTLFTYYLKENKSIDEITPSHLITCYRAVGSILPKNLPQTILDAKQKGLMTGDSGTALAKISNIGINLIEHELPRTKK